jgi:hydroxyacylglutathione hydrolase
VHFKQFYLESLGQASYFIGSEETGEALVLDVRRDADIYFKEAHMQEMRIRYAADTHQHNDYLSGISELPVRGEVQLLAGARAELKYPVRKLDDRERLEMGELVFEVLHTPGHTPEHISLLVIDRSRGDEPVILLSGGALLVDDVARPDLIGGPEEAEQNARESCRTLREKILTLPDYVEVYPTHVAGSLCGGNIGSRLSTTIGYERRLNKMLKRLENEDEFIEKCLDKNTLPGVPPYWPRMRKSNIAGVPLLGVLREPTALTVDQFDELKKEGALVLDCRLPEAFSTHINGALNVGFGPSFATWAGTIVPPDAPLLLVLERKEDRWDVCWQLLRIGYDLPKGWLAGGMRAWRTSGRELTMMTVLTVHDLHDALKRGDSLFILDVRQPAEWISGHIPQAVHITGSELPRRIQEVPRDQSIICICGSGYRSTVIASLLSHKGYERVSTVLGGMHAWIKAGYEIEEKEASFV